MTPPHPAETEANRALKAASRLLKLRSRSEAEIRERLAAGGFSGEAAEAAVAKLRGANLIDDARAAREWTDRGRRSLQGEERIRRTLASRGIGEDKIRTTVPDPAGEAARAWDALNRRAARLKRASPGERRRKLSAYLARQGFSEDVVDETMRRYSREAETRDEDIEE